MGGDDIYCIMKIRIRESTPDDNILKIIFLLILISTLAYSQLPAFPGAEGYGRFATGGRGGRVIWVTNLDDSGPGSFREAVLNKGPRIIVFAVAGNIQLESELHIKNGNMTIAGESAPGDGICIIGDRTYITADNIIIRFMRFRLGDERGVAEDALCVMRSKNVIIDHCSMSWGIDEVGSFYDNEDFTLQWSIVSEALNHSVHPKGNHGYGGIWGGVNASFHHNLLAHNSSRNPRFNGARTGTTPETEFADFRNNVIYNWKENSSYGGEMGRYNIINNYYKPGPASHNKKRILEPFDDKSRWYINGNVITSSHQISADNWSGGVQGKYAKAQEIRAEKEFYDNPVLTTSAVIAYRAVLAFSGAVFPKRDVVDERIIRETRDSTVSYGDGIIDSQTQAGGFPVLSATFLPADRDEDGIPDEWEINNNLNPGNREDAAEVSPDGYTYIEKYLHQLVQGIDEKK